MPRTDRSLATLALAAIVDALWGDAAPSTAVKAVQGYVSHLRRVLGSDGAKWSLAKPAPGLARVRTLVVVGSRDSDDCKALTLLPALRQHGAKALRAETIESDHSFNDKRIALQGVVLDWLAGLPGAAAK